MDEETETTRLTPQVIRIYPPPLTVKNLIQPVRRRLIAYLVILAANIAAVLSQSAWLPGAALQPRSRSNPEVWTVSEKVLLVVLMGGLLYFGLHVAAAAEINRICVRRRRMGLEEIPDESSEAANRLNIAMFPHWRYCHQRPTPAAVKTEFDRGGPWDSRCAQLVSFGDPKLPEPTGRQFEPEVFALGVVPRKALRDFAIAAGLTGVVVVAQILGLISGWMSPSAGACLAAACIPFFALWAWKRMVRPSYLRLAPGIVQVFRFSGGVDAKPHIHSYPMAHGTLVYYGASTTLFNGLQNDTIVIGQTRDPAVAKARTQEALQSTAPIPEMSDTELVG